MVWGANRAKVEMQASRHYFSNWSVRRKLLMALIPSVLVVMVVTGVATNWYASRYLEQALERTTQIQNLAQVREVERLFEYYRVGILDIAKSGADKERALAIIKSYQAHYPDGLKEFAFIGVNRSESYLFIERGNAYFEVPADQYLYIKNSPLALPDKMRVNAENTVLFSKIAEAIYPAKIVADDVHSSAFFVFRIITPVFDSHKALKGHFVIGINAFEVRNILSLYNSPKSPLYAFPRTSEQRFSFIFDEQGWMLLQSENYEEKSRELSIETSRFGMTGDYGMPDYNKAFRPSPNNVAYWRMVVETQSGVKGIDDSSNLYDGLSASGRPHYVAYAPLKFQTHPDKEPEIIGGIAYVDKSRLTDAAEFRHLDVMTVITLLAMCLITGVIYFVSKLLTMPIKRLSDEICTVISEKRFRTLHLPDYDRETTILKKALNDLLISLVEQKEQVRLRDEHIQHVRQRQKVSFDDDIPMAMGWRLIGDIPDLIGQSQQMQFLQTAIRKAASTDADVLIVGETGTGKELTAEGIHKFSVRNAQPFISINCGGLDENLLLDTLFGHVKGAFSEARADRKGAFLASDGGTLFLDEIGTASDKVQKALLRALSVRRIRPLGSDMEIEFNVRVVAATNVDLMELVQLGRFRDDLYYRLKVITIQTPSLRQRKDDIPILAKHFLAESCRGSGKEPVSLSRGALDKLLEYEWPGNVRELKNCITRAVAFSDKDILYAEDLVFDDHVISPEVPKEYPKHAADELFMSSVVAAASVSSGIEKSAQSYAGQQVADTDHSAKTVDTTKLKDRLKIAHALAKEKGHFTRSEYQAAVGQHVSPRSAQYDLKLMVSKNHLVRAGRGPSTVYTLP